MNSTIIRSGKCGDNAKYEIYLNGDSIFLGSGNMYNWDHKFPCPWQNVANTIKKAKIEYGILSIGNNTFWNYNELKCVTIPASITRIGTKAFYGCTKLTDVIFDGTKEQWDKIDFGEGNECLLNAQLKTTIPTIKISKYQSITIFKKKSSLKLTMLSKIIKFFQA